MGGWVGGWLVLLGWTAPRAVSNLLNDVEEKLKEEKWRVVSRPSALNVSVLIMLQTDSLNKLRQTVFKSDYR